MRHKIVLMTGGTETLEFFSLQLKKGFEVTKFLYSTRLSKRKVPKNYMILLRHMTLYLSRSTLTEYITKHLFLI